MSSTLATSSSMTDCDVADTSDYDNDGITDSCDLDDDNDLIQDIHDAYPNDYYRFLDSALESEYNDEREFADEFDKSIQGTLSNSTDVDWHKITVTSGEVQSVLFDARTQSSGLGLWQVSWYSPAMQVLSTRNISKDDGIFVYTLPFFDRGTYFIRITPTFPGNSQFHLSSQYTIGHAVEGLLTNDEICDGIDYNQDGIVDTDVCPSPDSDGDGIEDDIDAFPNDAAASVDSDEDGFPDSWNVDATQEEISASSLVLDAFPNDSSEFFDTDGDNIGDNADRFALDASEWADLDHDGIGNNSDPDDDGDGATDEFESVAANLNPAYADYRVSSFNYHGCVLSDGALTCFGGGGGTEPPSLNTPISNVAIGGYFACAITGEDRAIACWGESATQNTPQGEGFYELAVGGYHVCAINNSGVKCAGTNDYGQITAPTLNKPVQVAAGGHHTCALDSDGVECWGRNDSGQTNVPTLIDPKMIAVGIEHSCAVDDSGVVCWGDDSRGEATPPNLANIRQLGLGEHHSCAITDDGVRCWGDDAYSQVSNIPDLLNPVQISLGNSLSCALTDEGIVCWGAPGFDSLVPSSLSIDPDQDGFSNQGGLDAFPYDSSETTDTDGDGIGDNSDAFPNDASESLDTDGDGIGNNADSDDDGDGYSDADEILARTDPLDADSYPGSPGLETGGIPVWLYYIITQSNQSARR